ncbi:MAG TPA: hypothetical protein VJK49_08230 [Candidatus Limnocylindrales bacterium]|nr:hypothetical protein [Candidatus Limnocylindrales bacterium]
MRVPADKAVETVKAWAPAIVRVYTADDQQTDIAIPPKIRTRWHRFAQTLAAFPSWVRLEALDAKKQVVGVIENADAAADQLDGDFADLAEVGAGDGRAAEVAQLMKVMLAGQDLVLRRQNEQSDRLMEACVELVRVYGARIVELERTVQGLLNNLIGLGARAAAQQPDLGDQAETMLFDALGGKLAGGGPDQKQLGRFVGKVVREALRKEGPALVREAMASPAPAGGTSKGGGSTAGTSGNGPNGQNTPGS